MLKWRANLWLYLIKSEWNTDKYFSATHEFVYAEGRQNGMEKPIKIYQIQTQISHTFVFHLCTVRCVCFTFFSSLLIFLNNAEFIRRRCCFLFHVFFSFFFPLLKRNMCLIRFITVCVSRARFLELESFKSHRTLYAQLVSFNGCWKKKTWLHEATMVLNLLKRE